MYKHLSLSLITAVAAITLSAPLSAQQRSTVDISTLDAAISARPVTNRAMVMSALSSTEAHAAAATMGLTPEALATRIAVLDDATAKKMADQILAGGDGSVVISTTAIIIGLLLIILLTRN